MDNMLCPICQGEEKFVAHTLWSCLAATYVWVEDANPLKKWQGSGEDIL